MLRIKEILIGKDNLEHFELPVFIYITFLTSLIALISYFQPYFSPTYIAFDINFLIQFILTFSLYLLTRNGKINYKTGFIIFYILALYILSYSFFIASGIAGTTNVLFLSLIAANGLLSHKEFKNFFFVLTVLLYCSLYVFELYYPESIKPQTDTQLKFDILFTTLLLIIGIHLFTRSYWSQYLFQKQLAHNENKVVFDQNRTILKQNEELKSINHTKDKLNSIIAHDIKGPVFAFKDLVRFMSDNYKSMDEEEIDDAFLAINSSAENLSLLSQNLLAWSKNQISSSSVNPDLIFSSDIIEFNLDLLRPQIERKKLKVNTNFNEGTKIFVDQDMFSTIIRNILSNAIKFTPEEGEITLSEIIEDNTIKFSVKDTGNGISKEAMNKIFSTDSNYTTLGTKGEKGTGLGISICMEFATLNNGKLYVAESSKNGTEFILELPIKKPE